MELLLFVAGCFIVFVIARFIGDFIDELREISRRIGKGTFFKG